MDKIIQQLNEALRERAVLFENQQQVQEYNIKTAKLLMVSVGVVMFLVYCFRFLSVVTSTAANSYLLICALIAIVYAYTHFLLNPKYHLLLSYGVMIGFYSFLLYLDILITPTEQASAFIGGISLLPLMFIDRTWRISLITLCAAATSVILGYYFKSPAHMSIDAINSFSFAIGGIIFGSHMNYTRLKAFQLNNALIHQRDMDYLTNLRNRRKLFSLFTEVAENTIPRPCCAVMIDIDYFKQYNDRYGHAAGDQFLRCFGAALRSLEQSYHIKFYRYGGEEISAFMWGYDESKQKEITEIIRSTTENLDIEHGRTISIGYVNCTNYPDINMENALILADAALYQAKGTGRNRAMPYTNLYTA